MKYIFLLWFAQAFSNDATLGGQCRGYICDIFSVTAEYQRDLFGPARRQGRIAVPTTTGYVWRKHLYVDKEKLVCKKSAQVPKPIYKAVIRMMETLNNNSQNGGVPETYTPAQEMMLAFYNTLMKQTLEFECPIPGQRPNRRGPQ